MVSEHGVVPLREQGKMARTPPCLFHPDKMGHLFSTAPTSTTGNSLVTNEHSQAFKKPFMGREQEMKEQGSTQHRREIRSRQGTSDSGTSDLIAHIAYAHTPKHFAMMAKS